MTIAQISYGSTSLAFGALCIVMLLRWRHVSPHPLLFLACALTATWGAVIAAQTQTPILGSLLSTTETLKTSVWILFISGLLFQFWRQNNSLSYTFVLSMVMALVFTLQIFIDLGALSLFDMSLNRQALQDLLVQAYIFGRLIVAITGLALMENLYRSTEKEEKWKLRPMALAIGGLFIYDIVLYAEGLLFTSIDGDLFDARGFITAMAAPLLYLSIKRIQRWSFDVILTRRAVFHSLSLLVTGCYLILMAAAGWALRQFGGSWGAVLQIAFLCAAGGFLIYLFVSEGARSRARVSLAKYFRRYKYDYRTTWLKFIRRIDNKETGASLEARVLEGVCEILDSQGGRLYMRDEDDRFVLVEAFNFRTDVLPEEPVEGVLLQFLENNGWVIDFNDVRRGHTDYEGLKVPEWVSLEQKAWVIVPLLRNRLIGYILARQPRAQRRLDWEDHDLLKTIGMQAASYLSEQKTQASLAESEQFDAFNRRFAFIMHDLKNLVSQLSLLARNVERHGSDPEFQKDMAETLQSSVDKINVLLARLHQTPDKDNTLSRHDVVALAREVYTTKKSAYDHLECSLPDQPVYATVNAEKLEQVMTHLVQNAIDASTPPAPISLKVHLEGANQDDIVITVADNGCGMSADFVQKQLFKPFASTKSAGFGIGAYEARELTRQMNGHLSVSSDVGKGTSFVLKFARQDDLSEGTLARAGETVS